MLYQLYEAQRTLIEPFSDMANAMARVFGNPHTLAGQLPMASRVSAAYSLLHRLGKDYEKPEFEIRTVDVQGNEVAIFERIEMEKPFCQLRRFKRFTDTPGLLEKMMAQPTVLVVAPLSGHYATLLRDTVRTLLRDHKVFITDWKNARMVPLSEGEFHLHDYVNYVQEFIRYIQRVYGHCHVISVCQPTVPVLAAISLMSSRGEQTPLSMTMMGGPIDARKTPTAVNDLAQQRSFEWFENNVIYRVPPNYPGAGRRVYPGFLQHAGFIAMNPNRHANSHYDYFKDLIKGDQSSAETHRKFYDEYNAVLDMDADYYLETIRTVFQDFKLVKGAWDVKNPEGQPERVRPQDIRHTALMTIEGELDDIAGPGQTHAAQELCANLQANQRRRYDVQGAGHYGIFSGRRWREKVYPEVTAFIAAHHDVQALDQTVADLPLAGSRLIGRVLPVQGPVAKAPASNGSTAQPAQTAKAAPPKPNTRKPKPPAKPATVNAAAATKPAAKTAAKAVPAPAPASTSAPAAASPANVSSEKPATQPADQPTDKPTPKPAAGQAPAPAAPKSGAQAAVARAAALATAKAPERPAPKTTWQGQAPLADMDLPAPADGGSVAKPAAKTAAAKTAADPKAKAPAKTPANTTIPKTS